MRKVFVCIFLSAGLICAQDIFGLLPYSTAGWKAADSIQVFVGDDLYKLIDGGADIFREYGFNKCLAARYIDSNDNLISAEIYEMKDSSSAYGIFSLFTFNTGKRISFNCDAYEGEGYMLFQKGKYYVSLSGNETSETIQKGLIKIGEFIEENIQPAGKPSLAGKFDELNYSRIAFIKGNLGLYNLTNLTVRRNLGIEEGVCLKTDSSIYTILKFNSDENAEWNFQILCGILESGGKYKIIDSANSSVLLKDDEQRCRRINRYPGFVIISASSDQEKILGIPERIKEILEK